MDAMNDKPSLLTMLTDLTRCPDHILWLNADRREAAYHNGEWAFPVAYNDAVLIRTDPSIYIVENRDGEVLSGFR